MDAESRRKEILNILEREENPVSGTVLAQKLGVSRQIIVQDIALLRAREKRDLLATARGYILQKKTKKLQRTYTVKHTEDKVEEELNIFVDCGGRVLNVIVEHNVYGFITADLILSSRMDVRAFMEKLREKETSLLSQLTGGVHSHTVEAEREEILDYIQEELKQRGFLL